MEAGFCGNVKEYARRVMGVSGNLLKHTKQSGGIFVNGEPCFVVRQLQPGDRIALVIENGAASPNVFPRPGELDIVYEDEDILVLNKPAPLPVHPSKGHVDDSLANRVAAYYAAQGQGYVTRIVTRLDSGTSGLMVLAKHAYAHDALQKQLHGPFIREYLAVVRGRPENPEGTVNAPIARAEGATILRVVDGTGKPAVTHYKTVRAVGDMALLRLRLETGRTHQIRVHMAYIGHPLVGDFLYGSEDARIDRSALHSCFISFEHPLSRRRMEFEQPLPEDMRALLE